MNKYLRLITEYFPDWTEIYKNPENSVGGKFIKSFSKFLDNIDNIVQDIYYIDSLHIEEDNTLFNYEGLCLNKIDYISRVDLKQFNINIIETVKYDTKNDNGNIDERMIHLKEATSHYQFFTSDDLMYYIDDNVMYINKVIDGIQINGTYVSCILHHIWGPYDEIGLLIGLERQPGEQNNYYALRLKDHYENLGNSSPDKLKSYIIRCLIPYTSSLNNKEEDLVKLQELTNDYIFSQIKNGQISDELKNYIEISKKVNKNYTNSYWDVIEVNNQGLKFLPISWYITDENIDDKFIQNGVLTPDSLEIAPPELNLRPDEIDFSITTKSITESQEEYFPETEFKYNLIYKEEVETVGGTIPEEPYSLTVTAYETVDLEFDLVAKLLYENLTSTVFKPYVSSKIQIDTINKFTNWTYDEINEKLILKLVLQNQKKFVIFSDKDNQDIASERSEDNDNLFVCTINTSLENDYVEIIITESDDGFDDEGKVINPLYTVFGITLLNDHSIYISKIKDYENVRLLGINTSNKEHGTTSVGYQSLVKPLKIETGESIEFVNGTQVYYKEALNEFNKVLNAEILIKLKSDDEDSPILNQLNITYNDENGTQIKNIAADDLKRYIKNNKDYNIDCTENYLHLSDAYFKVDVRGKNSFNDGEYMNTDYIEGKGIGFSLPIKSN